MKRSAFGTILFGASFLFFVPAAIWAGDTLNNNEVEFTATITGFLQNGDGGGTLFVVVNEIELRVIVNPKAEIIKGADEVPMSDLAEDMKVRITGKYSSSGILASQVLIVESGSAPDNSFQVCGHITDIQASGNDLLLSLLGITVTADSTAKIEQDGVEIPATVLQIGLKVCVDGTVSGSTWTASVIDVQSKEKKKDQVRFEGQVTAVVDPDTIEVSVMGTEVKSQVVHYDADTRIYGTIAKDALVMVKGVLNPDLSVTAREIRVLGALEIKPDERKMKVGQAATFTVKLRETAVAETEVTLAASGTGTVSGLPASVKIPAGAKTAEFTLTAATMGEVKITAKSGTQEAAATIYIGTLSDDDTERPDKAPYMTFAPSHIKMGVNDVRDVVLLIKPLQQTPIEVSFTSDNALLEVPSGSMLNDGVAAYKVTIKSKAPASLPVATSVTVTLKGNPPDGPKAELLVTIEDKR